MASKKTLQLDHENKKFLGVCAGIANYLEVEAWTVRLVYLGGMIFGAFFLVPLYFFAWFYLDESSVGVRTALTDNLAVKHFRTVDYKKKLYRNPEEGKLMGVCAGIAEYLEISPFVVRISFLVLFFLTGFPLLFYIGALFVLDKKPQAALSNDAIRTRRAARPAMDRDEEVATFADGADSRRSRNTKEEQFSKRREFQYCARKFATLQTRLARLEAYVTSSRFKLHREFRDIS
ncbi:MAG: PspC domain-containing protein [Pseudomonadota bacterium]